MASQIILDGLIALFACIGIASSIWILLGIFIIPKNYQNAFACTVIAASGRDTDLEEVVHSLLWWHSTLPDNRKIIVLDCGLQSDEKDISRVIERKYQQVVFLEPHQVGAYITSRLQDGEVHGEGIDQN